MTAASGGAPDPAGRRLLDQQAASESWPGADAREALARLDAATLDATLWAFALERGPAALTVLGALAGDESPRAVRRAARRALYRLEQRGITTPAAPAPAPAVVRRPERPARAWMSGIDGTGSRAVWILFEGAYGALRLCSVLLNDVEGILDVAGGDITKKRLGRELRELAATQKLPWVEADPGRVAGLVSAALVRHRERGTTPPAAFERWRPLFDDVPPAAPPTLTPDPALVARGAELLELPEFAGWFLDPERVQADAVELLQARESRLVVSDRIKTEREEAIVDRVVERELDAEARRLWGNRLAEMSLVLEAAGRPEQAALAASTAAALLDLSREVRRLPLARGLAARGLEVAGQVTLGRLSAAEASRQPGRASPPPAR